MDIRGDMHPGASHHQTMPYVWVTNETVLQSLLDLLTPAVSLWPESKAYFLPREFGASGVTLVDGTSAGRYLLNEQMSE